MNNRLILALILLLILSACTRQNVTKYVCPDNKIVSDPNQCSSPQNYQQQTAAVNKGCIELIKYNDRRNEYGWLVIAGTVKNNCAYSTTGTIYFILYDTQGNVITSDYTHADPWHVPPGATVGFEQTWTDETVYSRVAKYQVSASEE